MEDKKIERHYWCDGCVAYRPISSRSDNKPCCSDGHHLDHEQWIDWTFPYAGGSENRV